MYQEPWSDIKDYPSAHRLALESELKKELSKGHVLFGLHIEVLAKREDNDDILVSTDQGYFIVHLTWSGKQEKEPFPSIDHFESVEKLKIKLASDSDFYS